jgi:hypothetical protein
MVKRDFLFAFRPVALVAMTVRKSTLAGCDTAIGGRREKAKEVR